MISLTAIAVVLSLGLAVRKAALFAQSLAAPKAPIGIPTR